MNSRISICARHSLSQTHTRVHFPAVHCEGPRMTGRSNEHNRSPDPPLLTGVAAPQRHATQPRQSEDGLGHLVTLKSEYQRRCRQRKGRAGSGGAPRGQAWGGLGTATRAAPGYRSGVDSDSQVCGSAGKPHLAVGILMNEFRNTY